MNIQLILVCDAVVIVKPWCWSHLRQTSERQIPRKTSHKHRNELELNHRTWRFAAKCSNHCAINIYDLQTTYYYSSLPDTHPQFNSVSVCHVSMCCLNNVIWQIAETNSSSTDPWDIVQHSGANLLEMYTMPKRLMSLEYL